MTPFQAQGVKFMIKLDVAIGTDCKENYDYIIVQFTKHICIQVEILGKN